MLIPVKAKNLKSRLAPILDLDERRELSELMLLDVLDAFDGAGCLGRCHVVTSDARAMETARLRGAGIVRETEDRGVNAAVRAGVSALPKETGFMVVPSDVPTLAPAEVRRALVFSRLGAVVIVPSRGFTGTNLLVFGERRNVDLSFDSDSFWSHLRSAAAHGQRGVVMTSPGFRLDVDSPADFEDLAKAKNGGRSAAFARRARQR